VSLACTFTAWTEASEAPKALTEGVK
jgi:hypothetical protein